jgi:hypothetical protein
MTFKPAVWRPIAFVLSALNLVAVGFAAGTAEPWHAASHATLALVFGLWAQRLGQRPGGSGRHTRLEELEAEMGNRLEAVETEMSNLGRELSETQERMDFAERLLAKTAEARRLDPEH